MKNKKTKQHTNLQQFKQSSSGISRTGWKIIFIGLFLAIAGYIVLSKTDPDGQNWASKLSPFLILGGYALIGIGIITPAKQPA